MRFLRAETEKMLSNQQDFLRFSVRAFMELVVFRINRRFKSEFERVKGLSDEIIRPQSGRGRAWASVGSSSPAASASAWLLGACCCKIRTP